MPAPPPKKKQDSYSPDTAITVYFFDSLNDVYL